MFIRIFFIGIFFFPDDLTPLACFLRLKTLSLLQLMPHSQHFARRRRRLTPIPGMIDKMIALPRASTHTHSRGNVRGKSDDPAWLVPGKVGARDGNGWSLRAVNTHMGISTFPCYRAVPANDVIVPNEREFQPWATISFSTRLPQSR